MPKFGRKRKLTPFLAQELLYDYAIDALDPERKTAVEDFLKENPETKQTLETIHKGFWYAEQLSKFEVNRVMVERLEESENIVSISQKVSSYKDYPDWLKWSLVTLLACGCIAIVVTMIPWSKINFHREKSDDHLVALAPLSNQNDARDQGEQTDDESAEHESSGDFDESGAPVEDDATPVPAPTKVIAVVPTPLPKAKIPPLERPTVQVAAATPKPTATKLPKLAPSSTPTPTPISTPAPVAVTASATPASVAATTAATSTPLATTTTETETNEDELSSTPAKPETKPKGFVYRAFMTLPNIENVADQITEQIKELGGAKAGEVELGWKRGSLRYYHFTIPEANEEKLNEMLRTYGPVRISKDPHPRVMPEGQVRFILSIDAK